MKPEVTPNSLVAAQPLVVKDLEQAEVKAEVVFVAPPVPGKYTLRIHVLSTSVIGIELEADVDALALAAGDAAALRVAELAGDFSAFASFGRLLVSIEEHRRKIAPPPVEEIGRAHV